MTEPGASPSTTRWRFTEGVRQAYSRADVPVPGPTGRDGWREANARSAIRGLGAIDAMMLPAAGPRSEADIPGGIPPAGPDRARYRGRRERSKSPGPDQHQCPAHRCRREYPASTASLVAGGLLRNRRGDRGSRRRRRPPCSQRQPRSGPCVQAQHLAPGTDLHHAMSRDASCRRCVPVDASSSATGQAVSKRPRPCADCDICRLRLPARSGCATARGLPASITFHGVPE